MLNGKRLIAAALVLGALGGCGPSRSFQAALSPPISGNPAVTVSGSHFPAATPFNVGVSTIWSPEFVGQVQTDAAGNIAPQAISFSCYNIVGSPMNVGLYRKDGVQVALVTLPAPPCRS